MVSVFTAAALAAFGAIAAPRTPYGGTALAMVWGMPIEIDPREGSTYADVTASGSIYETLYGIDQRGELYPILAKDLPRLEDDRLIVPLKEGIVFHDGQPLTPDGAARWLRSLADESVRASYVVLPVKGARERLAGDPKAELRIDARADLGAVSFTLSEPYADYARLLASPHAAVALALGTGSGPWRLAQGAPGLEQVTLEPFLGHRDGRPFLDALFIRPSTSRFGTLAEAKKGDAAIVFGVPDMKSTKRHEVLPWTKPAYPDELVLLAIGRHIESLRTPEAYGEVSSALNRAILAHRFLGQGAEPATTLFGEDREERPAEVRPARSRIDATLLVSKDDRVLHRIAERVQLDLLRAGVTVVIEQVPFRTLAARRKDKRYDLLLDSAFPAWPGGSRPIDRFHALLSLVAWAGAASSAVSASEYASFVRASESEQEVILGDLERTMRTRAALIPIAARKPAIAVRTDLRGHVLRPFGRLDVADAYIGGSR